MKSRVIRQLTIGAALLISQYAVAQEGMPPANVRVAEVRVQSIAPITIVPGTVSSRNDATLAAEVIGRLVDVAEVGTRVARGDVLARIEDTTQVLRKDELEAEVQSAEARLQYLESEVARFARLAESNLAAANQLQLSRSDRDMAASNLRVAKSRLAQNQEQLARTQIRAPFSGVVVERLMTPGERVSEGSQVLRLMDQDHLEVVARAPLEYFPYVREGQELELRSGPVTTLGIVRAVVAVGDQNTHLFEIRVDLAEQVFPAGQTVRVSVPTSEVRDVVAVPRDALVLRPEGITVFVVDANNQAQQISVRTGIGSQEIIEVLGAVSAGDQVIIRGNERLQPGQSVTILEG